MNLACTFFLFFLSNNIFTCNRFLSEKFGQYSKIIEKISQDGMSGGLSTKDRETVFSLFPKIAKEFGVKIQKLGESSYSYLFVPEEKGSYLNELAYKLNKNYSVKMVLNLSEEVRRPRPQSKIDIKKSTFYLPVYIHQFFDGYTKDEYIPLLTHEISHIQKMFSYRKGKAYILADRIYHSPHLSSSNYSKFLTVDEINAHSLTLLGMTKNYEKWSDKMRSYYIDFEKMFRLNLPPFVRASVLFYQDIIDALKSNQFSVSQNKEFEGNELGVYEYEIKLRGEYKGKFYSHIDQEKKFTEFFLNTRAPEMLKKLDLVKDEVQKILKINLWIDAHKISSKKAKERLERSKPFFINIRKILYNLYE